MRKLLLVLGLVFLTTSIVVLADGNDKFSRLSACSTLEICPSGFTPSSPDLSLAMNAARAEIVYGIVFASISALLLIFGIFGSPSKGGERRDKVRYPDAF